MKDLGVPADELGMHYEVDCFSYKDDVDPSGMKIQYEEPGVIFVTNAAGKEIRAPVSLLRKILLLFIIDLRKDTINIGI